MLISHLWQLKTVAFEHWCLICAILLEPIVGNHRHIKCESVEENSREYLKTDHFSEKALAYYGYARCLSVECHYAQCGGASRIVSHN